MYLVNKDGDATVAARRHARAGGGDCHRHRRPWPDVIVLGKDPHRQTLSCHRIGRRRRPSKSTSSPRSPGVRRWHRRRRCRPPPLPTTNRVNCDSALAGKLPGARPKNWSVWSSVEIDVGYKNKYNLIFLPYHQHATIHADHRRCAAAAAAKLPPPSH